MPVKRHVKSAAATAGRKSAPRPPSAPLPPPFKQAADSLEPFYDELSRRHMYIVHVDSRPRDFKRKIFAVPVLMNVAVTLLFVWRMWYIGPYYVLLFETTFGTPNETSLLASDLAWGQSVALVLRRTLHFALDLLLAIFVWPWPVEFIAGRKHGSPVQWRRMVGFRDKEIYVRRSRAWYTEALAGTDSSGGAEDALAASKKKVDLLADPAGRRLLVSYIAQATSPLFLEQKTGYLTMNGDWDLDWDLMVWATTLVDKNELALEAFRTLVLLHHHAYGWVSVDLRALPGGGGADSVVEDQRRLQVFAFREALEALGKEDLFFRWIEIIQVEVAKPGGLGDEEHQAVVAKQVRELFEAQGVDFDQLWMESVGSEGLAGM